jgi:hypothetical protein
VEFTARPDSIFPNRRIRVARPGKSLARGFKNPSGSTKIFRPPVQTYLENILFFKIVRIK